ncbi:MAG: hypothetical protein D6737_03705 [Chloroflexi bacterium]|nr:MAG: hypothetical protein D6737_03705 [Chloroflexota bacterium]
MNNRRISILMGIALMAMAFIALSGLSFSDISLSFVSAQYDGFSCCERDIKVNQVRVIPQNTVQDAGAITITINFNLDIHWRCDEDATNRCNAFYNIFFEDSNWQERIGGMWVDIPAARIAENIITDLPLSVDCDGRRHKGAWGYSYIATIQTVNPIRNTSLAFDWDVPAMKGRSYHAEYEVTNISPTTGTRPPRVRGPHPKQK